MEIYNRIRKLAESPCALTKCLQVYQNVTNKVFIRSCCDKQLLWTNTEIAEHTTVYSTQQGEIMTLLIQQYLQYQVYGESHRRVFTSAISDWYSYIP